MIGKAIGAQRDVDDDIETDKHNDSEQKMMVASVATMNEPRVFQRISSEIENHNLTQSGKELEK